MCVAIVKPANVDFPKELFEMAWRKNPHGGGYMYAADGKVIVRKGFMNLDEMMVDYEANKPFFGDSPVVLHFRIRTHGPVAPEQTHPHVINDRLAYVHNGTISIQIPTASTNSDTMEFNDRVLKRLPEGFIRNPEIMELIRGYVDPSRLVFLDAEKNIVIVNEESGHVDPQGRWHSNQGALAAVDPRWQTESFYEIVSSRCDPDISKWKGLSKKARKALQKEERKKGKGPTRCKTCDRELWGWEREEGSGFCTQCAGICKTCGAHFDPRYADFGVDLCERCMTDDERMEFEDILSQEGEQFEMPAEQVATLMIEMILDAEPGWENEAANLSADDAAELLEAAEKGFTEFTGWLRDHADLKLYARLKEDLDKKGGTPQRTVLENGISNLADNGGGPSEGMEGPPERGGGPSEGEGGLWEEFERNPGRSARKLYLIS